MKRKPGMAPPPVRPPRTTLLAVALLAVGAWFGSALDLGAGTLVQVQLVGLDGVPQLQVTLDPGPGAGKPPPERAVWIGISAMNQRGLGMEGFHGGHALKLDPNGKRMTAVLPLLSGRELPGDLDYIRVSVRDDELGIATDELLYPLRPTAAKPGAPKVLPLLQSYSVRLAGGFAERTAALVLNFGPHGTALAQSAAAVVRLLDGDGNPLATIEKEAPLSDTKPTSFPIEVTPKRDTTGPYLLSFSLTNETLHLAMELEARFPFATALVPLSSFESDTLADWHLPGRVPVRGSMLPRWSHDPLDPATLPEDLFSRYQPFARPAFDAAVKHGGTRGLRLDYTPAAPVVIGSNLRLPGLPAAVRLWVKGNNTKDLLQLEWRDPCNFNAAMHLRFMRKQTVDVCRLDFADWRCFTVPVMGNGLLARDQSTWYEGQYPRRPVQTPIYLAALRVRPEPPAKDAKPEPGPRSVWLDDLLVETQAPRSERLTLELRADTPEAKLHAGAQLFVTLGNGTGHDLRNGRLTVTCLDAGGETVHELAETIDAPAGQFAVKTLALGPVEARQPRGPVTAVVAVTMAGQRVQGRLVFSRPTSAGVCWDFERAEHFNPLAPAWSNRARFGKDELTAFNGKLYVSLQAGNQGKDPAKQAEWWKATDLPCGADPTAGGAEGTAQALPLAMAANLPASVILHPALPGSVESVELQVFGAGVPVVLQAVFADSGSREFDLFCNQFAAVPVRVDWQGWKACRFAAPPLPPGYATGEGNPMYAPLYPLNLVLSARSEDGRPTTIRVDQLRVNTHLAPKQELLVELDYPDETMLHPPGAPLRLVLTNFSPQPLTFGARYRLTTPWGAVADEGVRQTTLAPAARTYVPLLEKLPEGFYRLYLDGLPDGRTFAADVLAPDRKRYFGDAPLTQLASLKQPDALLGLTEKPINLDWDSSEPVPNLFLHEWFRRYAANVADGGAYTPVPIVGFAADWAGPERQPAVVEGSYLRDTGSYMQAPVRLADWNVFVRNIAREHAKEFKTWVFWQSPDMKESPVFLPPDKYRAMLDTFSKWISLYNPAACVVAGGFSFDRILGYLDGLPEPEKLAFQRLEIRVTPGEVPVEELQLEGFLEELDARLKVTATGRKLAIAELDWATGEKVALLEQAAYHARAAILLHAYGVLPHQFRSANNDETRDGFGVLFRPVYGNTSLQQKRPFFVPKSAYFALIETRKLLADLEFLQPAAIADRDPLANRACLFKQKDGGVCAAVWRVRGTRAYRLPDEWKAASASDIFGTAVRLDQELLLGPSPLFLRFPGLPADRVAHGLRNLRPREADAQHALVLDFCPVETYSRQAAEYTATGGTPTPRLTGRLCGGEHVTTAFLKDVTEERFAFSLEAGGDVLLSRLWLMDQGQRTLKVSLNGGPEQPWNLEPAKDTKDTAAVYPPGPRRSALVLRGCRSGRNEVVLRHAAPATVGGYRLTLVKDGSVDLTACGALACLDSGAPVKAFRNAWGGPLTLGKKTYAAGLGCLGGTVLEYPLNRQFTRFEVTVGIDAVTKGRGSVGFRILVDGVEKTKSGPMTGMAAPKTLKVTGLDGAERLLLMVDDGGDGPENDLANWVDPVLYLKEMPK